jgi:predicted O-methyltransferase YrrM
MVRGSGEILGDICKRRSVKPDRGSTLFWAVRFLKPSQVLELGSGVGISAAFISAALKMNGSGEMTTIEGCPALTKVARDNLVLLGLERTAVLEGRFIDILPEILPRLRPIELIFIDGHHVGWAMEQYFDQIYLYSGNPAIFLFDDIHWSPDMHLAWQNLRLRSVVSHWVEFLNMGVIAVGGPKSFAHDCRRRSIGV